MAESLISTSVSGKSSGSGGSIVEVETFTKASGVSKVIEGSVLFVFADTYLRDADGRKYGLGPCTCFCEVGSTSKNVYDVYTQPYGDPSFFLILTIGYSANFTVSIQSYYPDSGLYLVLG